MNTMQHTPSALKDINQYGMQATGSSQSHVTAAPGNTGQLGLAGADKQETPASEVSIGPSAHVVHQCVPEQLFNAVRGAAMLPHSVLAIYRQQTQHTQQIAGGPSPSITSADAVISSPPSGDYGAIGSLVPQLAATSGDCSGCDSPARSYHPGQGHPDQGCSSKMDDSCEQPLQATSSPAADQLRHLTYSSGATADTAPAAVTAPAAAVAAGTASACHTPLPAPNTINTLSAPPLTAAVPPWVADALNSRYQQQTQTAAAVTAQHVPPSTASYPVQPASAGSASGSITAMQSSTAASAALAAATPRPQVHGGICATSSMPAVAGISSASAAAAPPSSCNTFTSHASVPTVAAPVTAAVTAGRHQPTAADGSKGTGSCQPVAATGAATAGSGDAGGASGAASSSSSSSSRAVMGALDSGSCSSRPSAAARPDEASNDKGCWYQPLSEVAKVFLNEEYPKSAAVWDSLCADDLQCCQHQEAYAALNKHLTGMQVRVEFGGKKRDLARGIAYPDPRPPGQIMHANHDDDQVTVLAADGSTSVPKMISSRDFLFGKHGVELQHPEWPCVAYKPRKMDSQETAELEHEFNTYPLELISVIVKPNGEIKRGQGFTWKAVPLHALSRPGSNAVAAAVPRWIADRLNERCAQQLQQDHARNHNHHNPAAAAVLDTEQEPTAAVLTRVQHIPSSVRDGTPEAASSRQPATPDPQIITSMSADASAWIADEALVGRPQVGLDPATAPEQAVHLSAVAAAAESGAPGDTSSTADTVISANARALGLMIATLCNNLQPGLWLAGSSQAGTTSVHPTAAAPAGHPSGSVCQPPLPQIAHARQAVMVPSSSSVSSCTTTAGQATYTPNSSSTVNLPKMVSSGFEDLLSRLALSKQQRKDMSAVLRAICQTIQHEFSEQYKSEWQVAEVIKAGSFAKRSSLKGTSDLDAVVKLICQKPFHQCRKKFLAKVTQHLCRPIGSTDKSPNSPDCGWVWKDCHVRWFAKLEHPVLNLQLDIQVAQWFGTSDETRKKLLDGLLETAEWLELEAAGAGTTCTQRHNTGAANSNGSMACGNVARAAVITHSVQAATCSEAELRKKVFCDRQRVTDLTESSNSVVTGVDKHMREKYGVEGMGRLCTDTIRLMKAWSKYSLPRALAAAAAAATTVGSGQASQTVADPPKGPPGYLWEIVVVAVLWQGLEQGKVYNQGHPLQLFLDVLQAASKLRSTMQKSDAVIVPWYYSRQQALMKVFQDEWGPYGAPYAPYIISPVDPTYNCTENAAFRDYDALADAAICLYQQVKAAQSMPSGWQWLCEHSSLGPVAAEFGAG